MLKSNCNRYKNKKGIKFTIFMEIYFNTIDISFYKLVKRCVLKSIRLNRDMNPTLWQLNSVKPLDGNSDRFDIYN